MSKNPINSIALAVIVAGVIIAAAIIYTGESNPQPAAVYEGPEQTEDSKIELDTSDDPYMGDPEAPVKIVYYGDFQCPFCKLFETTAMSTIKENYLKTGKAVLYYKNFQFLGPDSISAGVAGECLVRQLNGNFGPYWKWHEAMIENQDEENGGWGDNGDIKILIRELELDKDGVDLNQFDTCLDNEETLEEVKKDTNEGQADGVRGTPTNFINGELISGIMEAEDFASIIESKLESN